MIKKSKTIISLIILIITILSVANIVASNAVATTGNKLASLHKQAQVIQAHNQKLQRQISESRSLSNIASKAKSLGLTPIDQTAFVSTSEPLAKVN